MQLEGYSKPLKIGEGGMAYVYRGIQESLQRLIGAGWLGRSSRGAVPRLRAEETAESALAWIRSRLARDHELAAALDALELAVTERVLAEYDDAVLPAGTA